MCMSACLYARISVSNQRAKEKAIHALRNTAISTDPEDGRGVGNTRIMPACHKTLRTCETGLPVNATPGCFAHVSSHRPRHVQFQTVCPQGPIQKKLSSTSNPQLANDANHASNVKAVRPSATCISHSSSCSNVSDRQDA